MIDFKISLDIPDVEILKIEKNKTEDLILTVKSTKDSCLCHKCGKEAKKVHGYAETILLRHLSILGNQVYIRIKPARYQCEYCNDKTTTTEQASWYNRRSKFTKAYEEYMMKLLINSTITDVSHKENVSYDDVEGVLNRQVENTVNWDDFDNINTLGFDEIALKKGHKNFIVIVSARIKGAVKILALLPDRKKETVKSFINTIPAHLKLTIKRICCDMYDGYINAAKETFDNSVKVVIDRFHIAKNYRSCIDTLRKQELRRLKQELSEAEYKRLKGAMWALRRKEDVLLDSEREVLSVLFKHSPMLSQAYRFQNELTGMFNQPLNKQQASQLITVWMNEVNQSKLSCFDKFLTTLNKNWDDILNYFHRKEKRNSGFIEGLNNKIKVIKRRCYGIFNLQKLFQRIFLDLEGYQQFV